MGHVLDMSQKEMDKAERESNTTKDLCNKKSQ